MQTAGKLLFHTLCSWSLKVPPGTAISRRKPGRATHWVTQSQNLAVLQRFALDLWSVSGIYKLQPHPKLRSR